MARARRMAGWLTLAACFAVAATVRADADRILRFRFTPTARTQIALWVERADGTFMGTVRLTQATSYRGIGNRPGAYAMNSGFRWPYGRREGVLPVWAHRRAGAAGAQRFPRVIFQDRASEGDASRTSNDASKDAYFCLSFNAETTRRDALDAVTCASVFNSDKGRYITSADIDKAYAEPMEDPGGAYMRELSLESLYPPRRDVLRCTAGGCADHADVDKFVSDAERVMPDIDAVTMATPAADKAQSIQFDVPSDWPSGDYVAWLEVNTEGDYNQSFNDDTYPTPSGSGWDYWAQSFGYPYRGQPSAVFSVPFSLEAGGSSFSAKAASGAGSIDGASGTLANAATLTDDPSGAPGSGADRLRVVNDQRLSVEVISTAVCSGPEPPSECGQPCDAAADPCPAGFLCTTKNTCTGYCDEDLPPSRVSDVRAEQFPNEKRSHEWGVLSFLAPKTPRQIERYEVRVGTEPMSNEADFVRAMPANAASLDSVELVVPVDAKPGERVEVPFGGMEPETTYYVAVRAIDDCNDASDFETASLMTTEINFTTVTPCFIATAAYGTP
ncbi:MAG: hypothetical protein KC417_05180, partial [Myxococcales bacterium]|nr:hypothetical protein [Myxococcales bacterium]